VIASLVAATICIIVAWFFIGKAITTKKGWVRFILIAIAVLLLLSYLGNSFYFFGVVGWIVGLGLTLLITIWMLIGLHSGATIYLAEINGAYKAGKTAEEAVEDGLAIISHRKPFSSLTASDKAFLVTVFSKIGPEKLNRFIVDCDKAGNIKPLTNREAILNYAKNIQKDLK
jgi:hypothetical protein